MRPDNGRLPMTLRLASVRRNVAEAERIPVRSDARRAPTFSTDQTGKNEEHGQGVRRRFVWRSSFTVVICRLSHDGEGVYCLPSILNFIIASHNISLMVMF
jgi:hypothetical protein